MAKSPFKRRLKWAPGDFFAVPLSDGTFGLAQIVAPVDSHAIDFVLLAVRLPTATPLAKQPHTNDAVAVGATWRTVVTGGHWAYVGHGPLLIAPQMCPNQRLLAAGHIEVSHSSWGLLQDLLSAYHGLLPWNMYPAFDYDSYLLPGVPRPAVAKILRPDQVALLNETRQREQRKEC